MLPGLVIVCGCFLTIIVFDEIAKKRANMFEAKTKFVSR